MRAPYTMRGFTLVELIITIVVLGIVSTAFGVFIFPAVTAYNALAQRAVLVDAGESALRRMARDVHSAVPNSVRVTNTVSGFTLELVPSVDGARHCASGLSDCTTAQKILDVTSSDLEFEMLGVFQDAGFIASPSNYRLAVGNTGTEIYTDSGSPAPITPSSRTITLSTVSGRHHILLDAGQQFCTTVACSPRQRLFVIKKSEAPVAYICDKGARTLTRYWGYTFTSAPTTAVTSARVADGVTDCSVVTETSDVYNTGIVTVKLTLTNSSSETVTLLQQTQLDNSQ